MNILFYRTKKTNKAICSVIVVFFLFSGMFFANTQKAHAIFGAADTVIEVGPNLFFNKLTQIAQWIGTKSQLISEVLQKMIAMDTKALVTKEYVLDPLLWALTKGIIRDFIGETIDWSRQGATSLDVGGAVLHMLGTSDGGPLFVTDLKKMMYDGLYQGSGIFINLYFRPEIYDFLPEPWRYPVLEALMRDRINIVSYDFPESTLHPDIDTQAEMAEFMDVFYDPVSGFGGWDSWLSLFDKPTNVPSGMYREVTSEMTGQSYALEEQLTMEAQMDSGFIGKKVCRDWTDGPAGPLCTKWITQSPGEWVRDQVTETTSSELRQFENADELSEMIFTLLNSVISSLISPDSSLLGGTYDPWLYQVGIDLEHDYDYEQDEWDPYEGWEDPEEPGSLIDHEYGSDIPGEPETPAVSDVRPMEVIIIEPVLDGAVRVVM